LALVGASVGSTLALGGPTTRGTASIDCHLKRSTPRRIVVAVTRVLALDIGTSSVRTILFDERGREVENTFAQLPITHRRQGEIDAERLLDATLSVTERARSAGTASTSAISAFWHSLVAVDDELRPLMPVQTWEDIRATPQAKRLATELDPDAVHARTGCALHPSYWPAKLAWLAEERPEVFAQTKWFVSFPDLVFHRLTGVLGISISMASGTGLLDGQGLSWDHELLDAIGVSADRLPPLLEHGEAHAGWFPPVGDGACSNIGAGCVTRDRAALMIGTSGAYRIGYEPDGTPIRSGLFRYYVDERRIVDGGALSDGGNLRTWLLQTLRLDETAVLGEPDSHGLTFLALFGGERSPGWRGLARGTIDGLTFETTPEQIFQAALESVAYRFAEIVELIPGVKEIVATGGALRAQPGWTQILADVLGRPLMPSAVRETSARGAAVLALERLGFVADEAPTGEAVGPRGEVTEIYRAARERQRRLYENQVA